MTCRHEVALGGRRFLVLDPLKERRAHREACERSEPEDIEPGQVGTVRILQISQSRVGLKGGAHYHGPEQHVPGDHSDHTDKLGNSGVAHDSLPVHGFSLLNASERVSTTVHETITK